MYREPQDGLLIILSSPSGAGKSTLARQLAEWDPSIRISVSATTRHVRDNEREGRDYFFLTEQEFKNKVKQNEFLEHAKVFGNYYGTPIRFIEETLSKNFDIVFDIDWQGGKQIKESKFHSNVVSIFILPPSIKALDERLRRRGKDSHAIIFGRMKECYDEIRHWKDYDYVLINNQIDEVFLQISQIVLSERLKRPRLKGLGDFVETLKKEFEEKYQ